MKPTSSPASLSKHVKGWIFDVYPSNPGEVAVWVIGENGERVRFTDKVQSKIYVSGKHEDIERYSTELISSATTCTPLVLVEVENEKTGPRYTLLDSIESVDYTVPSFRTIKLNVEIAKKGKIANLKDPIDKIEVTHIDK